MQTITLFATIAITTSAIAFNFTREDASSKLPKVYEFQTEAASDLENQKKLDKLVNIFKRYQKINQEQFKQTQTQQTHINEMIAHLDTKIKSIEASIDEQIANIDNYNDDEDKKKVSETDLGQSIDESLLVGFLNNDSTELATEKAQESITKVSGVNLEDMKCNDRFCRATFDIENNEQSAISDLFGQPPFDNEGFTIDQPNGTVLLYFAQPSESLEELRSEIQENLDM